MQMGTLKSSILSPERPPITHALGRGIYTSKCFYGSNISRNEAGKGGGGCFVYTMTILKQAVVFMCKAICCNKVMSTHVVTINITRCIVNNEMTGNTLGYPGGGGLYFWHNVFATIRETSFISNMAKNNRGRNICK